MAKTLDGDLVAYLPDNASDPNGHDARLIPPRHCKPN